MPSHIPNVTDPENYADAAQRHAHAEGLRALADWVEATEFPIPRYALSASEIQATMEIPSVWIEDPDFVKRVGSAARLIGGKVTKGTEPYGTRFVLKREFGGGVELRYLIDRAAVCQAIETTKLEARNKVVPVDPSKAAELERRREELEAELASVETTTITVDEVVPTVRYICPPSLLEAEAEQSEVA